MYKLIIDQINKFDLNKNMTAQNKIQKGFTLIELLVVIGILAVLLAITLIAINPARQFGNANNTARRSHVTQILNAVGQFVAENQGQLPDDIKDNMVAGTVYNLAAGATFPTLCADLVTTFIPALPKNPSVGSSDITAADCAAVPRTWDTGYQISKDASNRITVSVEQDPTRVDNEAVITVTR
mgnify:CR=1 FL=1